MEALSCVGAGRVHMRCVEQGGSGASCRRAFAQRGGRKWGLLADKCAGLHSATASEFLVQDSLILRNAHDRTLPLHAVLQYTSTSWTKHSRGDHTRAAGFVHTAGARPHPLPRDRRPRRRSLRSAARAPRPPVRLPSRPPEASDAHAPSARGPRRWRPTRWRPRVRRSPHSHAGRRCVRPGRDR